MEVLTKLVNGRGTKSISRQEYEAFIEDWLPDSYKNFQYSQKYVYRTVTKKIGTTKKKVQERQKKYLPTQMYCIMRCGMVHGYSFVAGQTERKNGGRTRSLWMVNRAEAARAGLIHLSKFSRTTPLPEIEDAAYIIIEEFIEHLSQAVDAIFDAALTDTKLKTKITKHLRLQRPIGG